MKRLNALIITLLTALTVFISGANAQANTIIIPKAPDLNVKAYILVDARTGAVLASKNADKRIAPASLTKLMTLYIVFDELKRGTIHLNEAVNVSKKAWKTGGSRMFLRQGSTPTVAQLLQGVIVDSGNDACVALAEFVAGTESSFVNMMNQQAQQLGMSNSHFMDATGLPNDKHYATAHDLAILARAIVTDFPQYYHYFSQKWFEYNNIKQPNRNRLLWRYKYADGLKTGHTKEAGYCLISSAKQNDMRLISVVIGAPSDEARAADSEALLTYGFRFFKSYRIYKAGEAITTPRVYYGENKNVPVGVKQDVFVMVPTGSEKAVTMQKKINLPLKAPIKLDQQVGTITAMLNGKVLSSSNLVALKTVKQSGFLGRMADHVSLGFNHFFGGSKK